MVVVVIIGVLASMGLPALTCYVRQSKASEAPTTLNNVYKSAASFYARERIDQGIAAEVSGGCIVTSTARKPDLPGAQKLKFDATGGFQQLGFSIADNVYFGYAITSPITTGEIACNGARDTISVYTFFANSDLDGDGIFSTFELAVGSDHDNDLFHARGVYIDHFTE